MKRVLILAASSVLLSISASSVNAAEVQSRNGCFDLQSQPSVNEPTIQCLLSEPDLELDGLQSSDRFVGKTEQRNRLLHHTSVPDRNEKGWIILPCTNILGDSSQGTCDRESSTVSTTFLASAGPIGSIECSGIRGNNTNTRPIQSATLEGTEKGYKLRYTEIEDGRQSVETMWKLDRGLVIEEAKTGVDGGWNLTSYNRQTPVTIQPTGKFEISMMVTSRSICTFSGTLKFVGNAQAQLFPGSSTQPKRPSKAKPSTTKIVNGIYWVGPTGMGIQVKGQKYQYYDEQGRTPWKPISELTYIRNGVFRTRKTYWCLSTLSRTGVATCTANGWERPIQ